MKKGISWICLIFSFLAIPYTWTGDIVGAFVATAYFLLVGYLCILNITSKKK